LAQRYPTSHVTQTPLSRSKGQGHQAAVLTVAFTREAGAAVTMKTYWAWETTATLRLLGGARGCWAPMGRRGTGAYPVPRAQLAEFKLHALQWTTTCGQVARL